MAKLRSGKGGLKGGDEADNVDVNMDQTSSSGAPVNGSVSADVLLKHPWMLWDRKDQCEPLLRDNLLESFKGAVQLRRRKTLITEEINKKRSRRSAAVKRALAAARADANKVHGSAATLGLDDLWNYLEREIGGDITPLRQRLETIVGAPPDRILKQDGLASSPGKRAVSHSPSAFAQGVPGKARATTRDSRGQPNGTYGGSECGEGGEGSSTDEEGEGLSDGCDGEDYDDSDDPDSSYEHEADEQAGKEGAMEGTGQSDKSGKVTKDRFFKMEEMEEFADRNFDDEADDFNYFESMGEESDGSKAAVEMMYGDFFDDPGADDAESDSESGSESDSDGNEALHCSRDLDGLDDDEREMELLLQKVEDEVESEEDEGDRDEAELVDFDHFADAEEDAKEPQVRFEDENDEISRVERDLVGEKHWSLMGEASGRKRPRNSLLDLDLELPQNSSFIHVEEGAAEEESAADEDSMGQEDARDVPIEIIIQQRIKAEVFDNVERKVPLEDQLEAIERLKQRRNKMDREEVEIDFNKSKMGLGDVYAKRYQEMFMATDQLDTHKQKLTEDFGKLMFKLDALCNFSIVPKRVSEAEKAKNVSSITVEAPINVVTASRQTDLVDDKMEANKITRNAKKRKFTNKIKALLKSGRATVEDITKMKQKMVERNRQRIQDAKAIKETGQTKDQGLRERRSNRRVNIAELMSNRH